jgi:neopullulanase
LYPRPDGLVTFLGNHDVTRFANAEGSSAAKLKLAFALTLTLRGIPQLYYGDEIGMPGGSDPDNRRDFPGGWREDTRNAFTEEGRTREQQEIFSYVQTLLKLRHAYAALSSGRLWHLFSDEGSYVFLRESEEERLLVVFNTLAQARELQIPVTDTPVQSVVRVSRLLGDAEAGVAGKEIHVRAPGQSLSIFAVN